MSEQKKLVLPDTHYQIKSMVDSTLSLIETAKRNVENSNRQLEYRMKSVEGIAQMIVNSNIEQFGSLPLWAYYNSYQETIIAGMTYQEARIRATEDGDTVEVFLYAPIHVKPEDVYMESVEEPEQVEEVQEQPEIVAEPPEPDTPLSDFLKTFGFTGGFFRGEYYTGRCPKDASLTMMINRDGTSVINSHHVKDLAETAEILNLSTKAWMELLNVKPDSQ